MIRDIANIIAMVFLFGMLVGWCLEYWSSRGE